MSNQYKAIIEIWNNNNSLYRIKTNIQFVRYRKDDNNIKILLPSKEDFIRFDFDTLAEDINIKIEIIELNMIIDNFRLGDMVEKYKNRLVYKIKWDLKIDKKRIQIKSFIINKEILSNIFIKLEKYATYI
jgi:hypothetical protein